MISKHFMIILEFIHNWSGSAKQQEAALKKVDFRKTAKDPKVRD